MIKKGDMYVSHNPNMLRINFIATDYVQDKYKDFTR